MKHLDLSRYPIILFSAGYGGHTREYTTLAEHLASHGYVVVVIQHTHDAVATELPNGQILQQAKAPPISSVGEQQEWDRSRLMWRVNDIHFVLDYMHSLDLPHAGQPLYLAGHSYGGATMLQLASQDPPRYSGIMLYDPWLEPLNLTHFHPKASLPPTVLWSIPTFWYRDLPNGAQQYQTELTQLNALFRSAPNTLVVHSNPTHGHLDYADTYLTGRLGRILGLYSDQAVLIEVIEQTLAWLKSSKQLG